MFESIRHLILWLYVINLGIAFGAGLYESRINVPRWLRFTPERGYRWNSEAATTDNVGLRFWAFVTTGPLTLLTLASLACAWTAPEPVHRWWLASSVASLVDRALTFTYFIPTMVPLMRGDVRPEAAAVNKARQWVRLGLVRHAATLVAWLAALEALASSTW